MVEINGEYLGEFRCTLQHGPSGSVIETDAPADNHGRAERFSPTDMIAAALASCISTTLAIKTRDRGWNLNGMRMHVAKHMSTDLPRRIVALPVELWMPIALEGDDQALVNEIVTTCPVHKSIHPDIDAPVKINWPES